MDPDPGTAVKPLADIAAAPTAAASRHPRHVKIILPTTNEGPWLRATVDSILDTTDYPSWEILVHQNGDTTTDLSFVGEPPYRERVRCRVTEEALGVGLSVNEAVEPGDAAYYAFLDAHCLVTERDWLGRAVRFLEEHPEASMMQPQIRTFTYEGELRAGDPVEMGRLRRGGGGYAVRWIWPYHPPLGFGDLARSPASSAPHEGMAGGGGVVFVSAGRFHALGRYDPEVGGWYPESMDYCIRAWLQGFPMYVDPSIRVLHRQKDEGRRYPILEVDLMHGVLRTAYKYLSPRRRDLAESLCRRHGKPGEVREALRRVRSGRWLQERAEHLARRVHDDDWLFAKFGVYEDRTGLRGP